MYHYGKWERLSRKFRFSQIEYDRLELMIVLNAMIVHGRFDCIRLTVEISDRIQTGQRKLASFIFS